MLFKGIHNTKASLKQLLPYFQTVTDGQGEFRLAFETVKQRIVCGIVANFWQETF